MTKAPRAPACCALTRRQFLRNAAYGAAVLGMGNLLGACSVSEEIGPFLTSTWRTRTPAPFVRHAHSGSPSGSRLLVMGDRRGVNLREGEGQQALGPPQLTVEIDSREFGFTPDELDVPSGVPVRIIFHNSGAVDHDFVIPSAGVYVRARPGESQEVIAVFREPAVYFCSIGGHADVGMVGELKVDGVAPTDQTVPHSDGVTEMWWYDPSSDTFARAPDLPHAFDHVSFVSVDEAVFSIGGYTGDIGTSRGDVWVLRAGAGAWERRADLPRPRGAMAVGTDGSRIFCTGGRSEAEGTPSAQDVFTYDPSADKWEVLSTALPTGRDHVAGVVIDNVFWVVGGRGDGRRVSSTPVVEGLDLETREWKFGSRLPVPESAGGVVSINGRVVVFGGEGPAPTPTGAAGRSFLTYQAVNAYDPATDTWARVAEMPVGVHHPAYGVIADRLYAIGGGDRSGVSATDHTQELTIDA